MVAANDVISALQLNEDNKIKETIYDRLREGITYLLQRYQLCMAFAIAKLDLAIIDIITCNPGAEDRLSL